MKRFLEKINVKPLAVSIAVSLGAGILSAILTNGMRQYADMYHPPLAPPGWLFPVVWSILYITMGVAAWLVYETPGGDDKRLAFSLYGNQLLANVVWPLLFFDLEAYFFAFGWLLLLWFLIYLTIRQFSQINRTAGLLLVPYLVWVTFAGYLNLAIALHYS